MTAVRQILKVGKPIMVMSESASDPFATIFEDDGETGYFYAMDARGQDILDSVHIYDVHSVVDRARDSEVEIVWSEDRRKSALLINRYPHAVFDFIGKQGFCRMNFPNFPQGLGEWRMDNHEWDDSVLKMFDLNLSS